MAERFAIEFTEYEGCGDPQCRTNDAGEWCAHFVEPRGLGVTGFGITPTEAYLDLLDSLRLEARGDDEGVYGPDPKCAAFLDAVSDAEDRMRGRAGHRRRLREEASQP